MIEPQTAARFRTEASDGCVVLVVGGQLDVTNHDLFRAILEALLAEKNALTVDLSDVSFIGSDAIGVLILAEALAYESGVAMDVITSPTVAKLIDVCGLTRVLAA